MFKFKTKISGRTENDDTKNVKGIKYLSNFWRALKMSLSNCEIDLIVTWSANDFIIDAPEKFMFQL